ncbi:MAG: hypothetical protein JOZ78_12010 [Chroococcidiopsidaceae cyanobacterium CP_BM_ER_R8_30]|nr:hypothetical protein [Chroococcidiopsidaceae cyanobacterium CP_BM_ER_R8_30]
MSLNQVGFVLKVLIISTGLSAAIKYFGPTVSIATTPLNILVIVTVPTLILASVLLWRILMTRQLD